MVTDNRQKTTVAPDEGQRFDEQIDPYLSFLRTTPVKLAQLIEHIRRELVDIESDQNLSVKATRVEVLRERGREQFSELLLTIYSVQESVERILMRAGRPPEHQPETTEEAILQEIREWRAWSRALRLLDAGIDTSDVIGEMAGDRVALRALRAELPAYLKSRGQGNRVAEMLAAIDEADMALPPALRGRVDAARTEYEAGWSRLKQAIQRTGHELKGNWGAVADIPDWVENRTIKLATLADFYQSSHGGHGGGAIPDQPGNGGSRQSA